MLITSRITFKRLLFRDSRSLCTLRRATVTEIPARNEKTFQAPNKQKVIFVLGGPGAGKGTQCELLSTEFGMVYLSAGELLRSERESGSAYGHLIQTYLSEGKIVPVQVTLDLLKKAMSTASSYRFLVDGFPRNWDNIQGWEASMKDVCDVEAVIFIDCPENVLQSRILTRGLTSGRSDDNIETVKKRFTTYTESTLPILKYYEESKLLMRIRGDATKDSVFNEMKRVIHPILHKDLMISQQILVTSLRDRDWSSYVPLCDMKIHTKIHLDTGSVEGDGVPFHLQEYFEKYVPPSRVGLSRVGIPVIEFNGTTAEVRTTLVDTTNPSVMMSETRQWTLSHGLWLMTGCVINMTGQ
jgi:UMP-CMP kinase